MSIYINDCNKVNDIFINVNGKKKINSMWVNKNGNPAKVFSTGNKINDFSNITWADGTDEEIAAMLDAHYAGLIDIHDYWHVGDERVVHLGIIPTLTFGDYPHMNQIKKEQDIKLILLNSGGKTLIEPVNNINECAFIVGFANGGAYYMNGNIDDRDFNVNNFSFIESQRRTWLNTELIDNMPMSLKTLFKLHYNLNYTFQSSENPVFNRDYLTLPSEMEVFGSVKMSKQISSEQQFEYYKQKENRPNNCFLRSIYYSNSDSYSNTLSVAIKSDGNVTAIGYSSYMFLYPFGCV